MGGVESAWVWNRLEEKEHEEQERVLLWFWLGCVSQEYRKGGFLGHREALGVGDECSC